MTEQEYREALRPYKAWYGDAFLVCQEKIKTPQGTKPTTASEDPTGNGVLYLCLHMLVLEQNGWMSELDRLQFAIMIKKCMPKAYGLCQRSPWKVDLQSHDDLKILMYTCKALGFSNLKMSIYYYCQQTFKAPWWSPWGMKYIYNTETPEHFYTPSGQCAWLGRFLDLRAHFAYCMEKQPSILERALWNLTVDQACNKGLHDHTSWLLTYALTRALCNDKSQIKVCASWEQSYVNKFSEEHYLGKDGLFANCLEMDHPTGLAFKWSPRYLGKI